MSYAAKDIFPADPLYVGTLSRNGIGDWWNYNRYGVPASGSFATQTAYFVPLFLAKPYRLARWFWLNGATVGTDFNQIGIYDEDRNLRFASSRTLSAGTANRVQYATPGIHATNITFGLDSTDATVYTTASVTLKAGVLYLMCLVNTAASAAVVSSIDSATGGFPTFTSRSSVQFNGTAHRVSIWSAVPTADFTGTLRINFGATQTGAKWGLQALYHVDTVTNDGIVQQATGTGNSTTPLATLGAFGSANNATLGAFAVGAQAPGTPESSYIELTDDNTAVTPAQSLHVDFRPDNDTTVSETITSGQWGACAVEIKSLGTGVVVIPRMRGWMAMHQSGATATPYRIPTGETSRTVVQRQATLATLPAVATFAGVATVCPIFGFTRRSSP